jgi:hypothetical protein
VLRQQAINIERLPNGVQFRLLPRYATARFTTHMFAMRCRDNEIERRLTKINHPCANGQVERMNRTIKEATVHRYHYDSHTQLKRHLNDFVDATTSADASRPSTASQCVFLSSVCRSVPAVAGRI